jgi:hypothetical protein
MSDFDRKSVEALHTSACTNGAEITEKQRSQDAQGLRAGSVASPTASLLVQRVRCGGAPRIRIYPTSLVN